MGGYELVSLSHVRMKLPDKREVGSSTLPRPIDFISLPRERLGAGGVLHFGDAAERKQLTILLIWCTFFT